MKDLLITVYGGGDEAVAAVQRMGDDWRAQLEQAAAEIELLRGYRDEAESDAAVARMLVDRLRLTDAEREAIRFALGRLSGTLRGNKECDHYDALSGLLARCATGHQ